MLHCSHLIVIVCLFVASTEQANGRIVGGNPVNIEQYPYQVSLRDKRLRHFCGGIIVTPRTILTAGHCVSTRVAANVIVVAGGTFLKPEKVTRNVRRILVHPQYNPITFNWDAALLYVSSALSCSPSVQSIPLAINEAVVGRNASVTGWGNVAEGGPATTDLRVVYVSIVARAICARNYAPTVITPIMICAGLHRGGKGPCQGDSGGPLVIKGKVFGIVSYGQGCARPNRPGVFTNVAIIRPWVMLNVI